MAVDYFLKLDGIDGESTDDKHKGEIELDAWSWGETNASTISSGTGGAGAGKVNMSDFSITKKVDKSSPVLMKRCAIGEPIKSVTLTARKAGKDQLEFLKYMFSNCFVTSYQIADAKGGDTSPMESLTFGFEKIEMAYSPQKPDGSLGGEVKAGYDQSINKAS